jgi:ubiquinone/menaquinone biosynthesis C-methylase UbiE
MSVLRKLLKRMRGTLLPGTVVSTHYVELRDCVVGDEASRLRSAWKADELPRKQRQLVNRQLAEFRKGMPVDVFDVMVAALRDLSLGEHVTSVLEVGCSSGFYSEVIDIAGLPVAYAGCDYSEAFIALARKTYPALQFDVEDATALSYQNGAFDVVISGCCLLHIPEYETAVAETVRVAKRYAIFHRTPVVTGQPNMYFRKLAYGVETVEIHFNEPEFLALLQKHGLELLQTYTLSEQREGELGRATRTYLCRKTT